MYKINSPIPFEVGLESYCKDCDMADLTIDVVTLINERHRTRMIQCRKHSLCSSLYRQIKKATEKGEDNGIQD